MHQPPPAPKLDYPEYVVSRRLELRKNLGEIFSDSQPQNIILEIGCGHGHFLVAYGRDRPTTVFLGIDLLNERIVRAEKKRKRMRLSNVHFLRAEALEALGCLPPHVRISEAYVLFPDPWPKRRHHKNRIMQSEFLAEVWNKSCDDARLYFRTDDIRYFAAAQKVVESHPGWKTVTETSWPFEIPTVFQQRATHFNSLVATKVYPTTAK